MFPADETVPARGFFTICTDGLLPQLERTSSGSARVVPGTITTEDGAWSVTVQRRSDGLKGIAKHALSAIVWRESIALSLEDTVLARRLNRLKSSLVT